MQVYVRLGIRLLYKASSYTPFSTLGSGIIILKPVLSFDGQGARSRLEGARGMLMVLRYRLSPRPDSLYIARGLLKSLSIKQGIKYDALESAYEIPAFIEFHKLNVNEILDPLPSFSRSYI